VRLATLAIGFVLQPSNNASCLGKCFTRDGEFHLVSALRRCGKRVGGKLAVVSCRRPVLVEQPDCQGRHGDPHVADGLFAVAKQFRLMADFAPVGDDLPLPLALVASFTLGMFRENANRKPACWMLCLFAHKGLLPLAV